MSQVQPAVRRSSLQVLVLCCAVMILEGYDVVAFGAAVPGLLRDVVWGIDRATVATLGSLTVAGMLLGALAASVLADRVGRRPILIASVAVFSAGMAACALAPGLATFTLGRVAVGIGAGCVLPTVAALVADHAAPHRRHRDQGIAFAGIGVGGALSGLATLSFTGADAFRWVFAAGALPALVLIPVLLRKLPESAEHLLNPELRQGITPGSWRVLLAPPYTLRTLLFWLTTFLSLLLLFGANTWLPVLLTANGYTLGSALTFLLALNLGLMTGSLISSTLADRFTAHRVIALSFTAAALAFVLLALRPPTALGYLLVAIVGAGAMGTQLLVNAYIAGSYPVQHRAAALGSALGVGRLGGILGPLYGGWLLSGQYTPTGFYGFAVPALLAAATIFAVRRAEATPPS